MWLWLCANSISKWICISHARFRIFSVREEFTEVINMGDLLGELKFRSMEHSKNRPVFHLSRHAMMCTYSIEEGSDFISRKSSEGKVLIDS
jgi:hypothetical protein